MAFRRNMDVSADLPNTMGQFLQIPPFVVCVAFPGTCCAVTDMKKILIMRLVTGPAASQSSRRLIPLSSSWRGSKLILFSIWNGGGGGGGVNQGYLWGFFFSLLICPFSGNETSVMETRQGQRRGVERPSPGDKTRCLTQVLCDVCVRFALWVEGNHSSSKQHIPII